MIIIIIIGIIIIMIIVSYVFYYYYMTIVIGISDNKTSCCVPFHFNQRQLNSMFTLRSIICPIVVYRMS